MYGWVVMDSDVSSSESWVANGEPLAMTIMMMIMIMISTISEIN